MTTLEQLGISDERADAIRDFLLEVLSTDEAGQLIAEDLKKIIKAFPNPVESAWAVFVYSGFYHTMDATIITDDKGVPVNAKEVWKARYS